MTFGLGGKTKAFFSGLWNIRGSDEKVSGPSTVRVAVLTHKNCIMYLRVHRMNSFIAVVF